MYAAYSTGRDLRSLSAVVGEEALSATDKMYLKFADEFETRVIKQDAHEDRSIEQTLELGWELLAIFPESELKRLKKEFIEKYGKKYRKESS